ncbi:glycine betaine ABC transporter substrate-binding protein [Haloarchaeobius sp. HME9146]|uniref:glycine betaine ABC transporter substrate-binding protein n=1 Tax=Haloarchaeobius sp. HME9146 TaxID=2978732 RepID=UPI0021BEC223|nr:glycine betaine ABC transporter substrate-binding protein [Haloarchaeobius sp. HME9146]MCT9095579.1 glycine/betaine ABC transporter substrate-binding protein [Haloarchaeobius sp. HME9146]
MTQKTTRRDALKTAGAVTSAAGLTALAGCSAILGGGGGGGSGSITVGSKQFTEQEVLGYLAVEALKANTDVDVNDKVGLGGSVTNFEALKSGQTDMYWEYTGTAWATLPPKHSKVITDPEKIQQKVESEFESEHDITLLDRAPFNNTYVLCVRKQWAEDTGVTSISDYATYLQDGNTDHTLVMDAEFQEREDGWPGLIEHYDFADAAKQLNVKNVSPALGYQIVGEKEAAVTMGFNTNPKILKFDLQSLEDDKGFFPVYNPAPMVRQPALEENPSIEEPLNEVANALSTDTIRSLNRKVSIDKKDARTVAKNFLESEGLV